MELANANTGWGGIVSTVSDDLRAPVIAVTHARAVQLLEPLARALGDVGAQLRMTLLVNHGSPQLNGQLYITRDGRDGIAPVFTCYAANVETPAMLGVVAFVEQFISPDNGNCPEDIRQALLPQLEQLRASASIDAADPYLSMTPEQFSAAIADWQRQKKEAADADPAVKFQRVVREVMSAVNMKDVSTARDTWAQVPGLKATEPIPNVWPSRSLCSWAVSGGDKAMITFVFAKAVEQGLDIPVEECGRYVHDPELLEWLHTTYGPLPPASLSACFDKSLETHDLHSNVSLAELRWRAVHGAVFTSCQPQLFGLVATRHPVSTAPAEKIKEVEECLTMLYEAGCPMSGARDAVVLCPWSNGGEFVHDGIDDPVEKAQADPGNKGGLVSREEVGLNYAVQLASIPLFEYFVSKGASPRYGEDTPLLCAVSQCYPPATQPLARDPEVEAQRQAAAAASEAMLMHIINAHGGDPRARDSLAVLLAYKYAGNISLAKRLVDMGAQLKPQADRMMAAYLLQGERRPYQQSAEDCAAPSCPTGNWLLAAGAYPSSAIAALRADEPHFDFSFCPVPKAWLEANIVPHVPGPVLTGLGWGMSR